MKIKRLITRTKVIWSELDYAQRRLLEIRTGIDVGANRKHQPGRDTTIEELEQLYAA